MQGDPRLLSILALSAWLVAGTGAVLAVTSASLPVSKGRYRVPYATNTEVRINRDHENHPVALNRLDMIGIGGSGTYTIVAAGDGWIRCIDDENTITNCASGCGLPGANPGAPGCANNYVWIEHTNGEWTKYTHLQKDSVDNQGRFVGEFVASGTPLGLEGSVGLACGQHLHFEVAFPNDPGNPIDGSGFLLDDGDPTTIIDPSDGTTAIDYNRQNRVPVFCGEKFVSQGDEMTAGDIGAATAGALSQHALDDNAHHTSFWIPDGNDTIYTTRNFVGVNTTSPGGHPPAVQIRDDVTDNSPNAARLELLERAGLSFNGRASLLWNGAENKLFIDSKNGGVNSNVMVSKRSGLNVGIGTSNPSNLYRLSVNGGIRAKEVVVETGWSDFVFADDYRLRPLGEVRTFIDEHGHLPDIPSAEDVEANGVSLGEMQSRLLQKVEELTLYLLDMQHRVDTLTTENEAMRRRIDGSEGRKDG